MENGIVSQKKLKNKTTIWPSNSTLGYVSEKKNQKTKTTNLKRYMHSSVHSIFIYNCKDMEAT